MSKGEEILDAMCGQIGIKKEIVKANKHNSGGAQKLMKNLTSTYWKKVEIDARALYNMLNKMQNVKNEDDPYGIQSWTASMWAELWNAWYFGKHVEVIKEFDFCWATCPISRWDDVYFFHNAGVQNNNQEMFYKAEYMHKYPFGIDLKISDKRCSYNYYEIIKGMKSCLV
jgi:hypothetical protein